MKNLSIKTDNQLLNDFREGNNRALEVLIDRYKDKLFSTILFLVKDKYLAEDLFQDTFIKIIDTIRNGKYTEEGKFLPWAMRISHNLCVDYFRKLKRSPDVKTSDDKDIFELYSFNEEATDTRIMREETNDHIRRILNNLPQEQREVIVLRQFGDFSFKEISEMTNCSINTSLGRMRYGLINIRRMVTDKKIAL
jgi:RNA polymerase sigma-70 factor (ECF subfamily)